MKSEENPPPTTSTFSAAQWPQTNHIPIDPALQQQSQHAQHTAHPTHTTHTPHTSHPTTTPYSHYQYSHYAQTSYSHYPQYAQQTHQPQAAQPVQTQMQTQVPQPTIASIPTAPRPAAPPAPTQQSSSIDTTDVATLNDAIGSAGVDLRAEEESLQRSNDNYYSYRPYEDRSRKQPAKPNFDTRNIGQTMRAIGTQHKVPKIPEDSVNYLALALRTRLQDLITAMIAAAQHRNDAQFDRPATTYEDGRPMWNIVVRTDVSKQLSVIEKVEREEEMRIRRERKERIEAAAAAQSAALAAAATGSSATESVGMEEEGGPKKKKKKDGPGVTARNMPEDLRKKMSNAVAKQAAGLGTSKYAWMSAANGGATPAKAKPAPAAAPATRASTPATTTAPVQGGPGSSGWARPYQSTKSSGQQSQQSREDDGRMAVTLRDAIFVVENEKGHGGGRGAALGWT